MNESGATGRPEGRSADLQVEGEAETVATLAVPTGTPRSSEDSVPSLPSRGLSRDSVLHGAPLQAEEAARARGWSLFVIALCAGALAFLPFLPGSTAMKSLFEGSLLILGAVAAWVWHRARSERTYTTTVFRIFGWTAATCSFGITYFVGVFSPVPLIVTLGISFFGLGIDRTHAIVIPLYALVGYVALGLLISFDVLPDLGMIRGDSAPLVSRIFFVFMVPFIYVGTLWLARIARSSMMDAIARTNRAQALARQRAAQLKEAAQDLEDVLRAGAGQAGRHTGTVAGMYRLAEVIGRGAMGEVYAASRDDDETRYAVKVLRADKVGDARLLERFFREGELMARLQAANVVRVYEVGALPEGLPFIAMEYLDGEDLSARLRRHARLKLRDAVELIEHVAAGLGAAHAEGIVHRDLKPRNIFCAQAPRTRALWKILDFGVSKLQGSTGTLTQHAVVGTPGYMSPEQARGEAVDHRCDIFALGAVAYRVLTGSPPFRGADTPQILFEVVYQQPVRPSSFGSALGPDVDRVLALALAKDPADRFQSAREFAEALAQAAGRGLPEKLTARADAVVARHGWGEALGHKEP